MDESIKTMREETIQKLKEMLCVASKLVQSNKWQKDWQNGGCYLFLECAEFIEALRGKGDPIDEAADVFTSFLALIDYYKLDLDAIVERCITKNKSNMGKYLIK